MCVCVVILFSTTMGHGSKHWWYVWMRCGAMHITVYTYSSTNRAYFVIGATCLQLLRLFPVCGRLLLCSSSLRVLSIFRIFSHFFFSFSLYRSLTPSLFVRIQRAMSIVCTRISQLKIEVDKNNKRSKTTSLRQPNALFARIHFQV